MLMGRLVGGIQSQDPAQLPADLLHLLLQLLLFLLPLAAVLSLPELLLEAQVGPAAGGR